MRRPDLDAAREAEIGRDEGAGWHRGRSGQRCDRPIAIRRPMRSRATALLGVALLVGCSSSTVVPPVDGSTDAPASDASDDGATDASSIDASADSGDADSGSFTGIACGVQGLMCDPSTVCCDEAPPSCSSPPVSCAGGHVYACDGPEDCTGGEVCCILFDGGPGAMAGSSCLPSCVTGAIRYPACHDARDCEPGGACCDSLGGPAGLGPYRVCFAGGGCPL